MADRGSGKRRYYHLDSTRIACVICICIGHGSPEFGEWNVIFCQNWVFQLLFIVSGVSFALSRRSFPGYLGRLCCYFCLGVVINVSAWSLQGLDWKHNFFTAVYHFMYIAAIFCYSLLLYPLKSYLQKVHSASISHYGADDPDLIFELFASKEVAEQTTSEGASEPMAEPATDTDMVEESITHGRHEGSRCASADIIIAEQGNITISALKALAFVSGIISIAVFVDMVLEPFLQAHLAPALAKSLDAVAPTIGSASMQYWNLGSDLPQIQQNIKLLCFYTQSSMCSISIVVCFPLLYRRTSLIGWLLMANMFLNRVLVQSCRQQHAFHGYDLFLLAFVIAHLGLRHRLEVATVISRYWLVMLIVCGLVWSPGTHQLYFIDPPKDPITRLRVNSLDAFFILAWLVAGEYLFDDRIFTQDKLGFLNLYALLVFLFHKALFIVFPLSTSWAVLLLLAPFCWLWTWLQAGGKSS